MDDDVNRSAVGADTLIDVLDEMAADGYDTQQIARPGGRIECTGCDRDDAPASFQVDRIRRLEGASDAADQLLVVCALCPSCGRRGVLTLTYGPNASTVDAAVTEHLDFGGADASPVRTTASPAEQSSPDPHRRC